MLESVTVDLPSQNAITVCTGLQAQCNATGVTPILRLPFSLAAPAKREQKGVGLEFNVSGTVCFGEYFGQFISTLSATTNYRGYFLVRFRLHWH